MLARRDREHKFRWVDAGIAGSWSDAQIFNASQLKAKVKDGSIGFPNPCPITQDGPDVPYFILVDDAFALNTWRMKSYGRRMLTRQKRIANCRISRGRRVVEHAFGIMASRFTVLLTTMEQPLITERNNIDLCGASQEVSTMSAWWSTTRR